MTTQGLVGGHRYLYQTCRHAFWVRGPFPCISGSHARQLMLGQALLESLVEIGEGLMQRRVIARKRRAFGFPLPQDVGEIIQIGSAAENAHLAAQANRMLRFLPQTVAHDRFTDTRKTDGQQWIIEEDRHFGLSVNPVKLRRIPIALEAKGLGDLFVRVNTPSACMSWIKRDSQSVTTDMFASSL